MFVTSKSAFSSLSCQSFLRPERLNLGPSCRWVDGAVRQQCAVHLPFERQATVNGGFPILPTGSTDPVLPLSPDEGSHSLFEFSPGLRRTDDRRLQRGLMRIASRNVELPYAHWDAARGLISD